MSRDESILRQEWDATIAEEKKQEKAVLGSLQDEKQILNAALQRLEPRIESVNENWRNYISMQESLASIKGNTEKMIQTLQKMHEQCKELDSSTKDQGKKVLQAARTYEHVCDAKTSLPYWKRDLITIKTKAQHNPLLPNIHDSKHTAPLQELLTLPLDFLLF